MSVRPRRPGHDTTSHIFIVGLPRTGSTLTRGIVNASADAWVAGESHYFPSPSRLGLWRDPGYAARFRRIGDLRTDDGLRRVVDHIFALRGKSFWARLATRTDATAFADALRMTDRSERALLDVAMRCFADGRPIVGEKTPHHIYAVPTLLDWFPNARVIHTFRDPRAVYVSLRRKERSEKLEIPGRLARRLGPPFEVYAVLNVAHSWSMMLRLHRQYAERYPDRYRLQRFEDLVADPAGAAHTTSEFLGIEYADAMLEQVVHNSSFMQKGAGAGIDAGATDRWRQHLSPLAGRLFRRLLGSEIEALGYRV